MRIISLVLLVLLLNLTYGRAGGPLGWALTGLAVFAYTVFNCVRGKPEKFQRSVVVIAAATAVLYAVEGILRANPSVHLLLALSTFGLTVIACYILINRIPFVSGLSELIASGMIAWASYVVSAFAVLSRAVHVQTHAHGAYAWFVRVRKYAVGVGVGIPLVLILVGMLSSADPVYASAVRKLAESLSLETLFGRAVYTVFVTALALPVFLLPEHPLRKKGHTITDKLHFTTEMTIVAAMVAAVMATFLAVQWPYIFVRVASETNLSKFGVATYSEYVRKGFGELLVISFILYAVSWIGLLVKRASPGKSALLGAVLGLLLAEGGIFILSVFRRIWLYQTFHGWSLIRIYGGFFLLWIAAMFLFLGMRHILRFRWVVAESLATLAIVLAVGAFNAEHFIVTVHPPTVNGRIDHIYMSRMSPDGADGWVRAYEFASNTTTRLVSKQSGWTDDDRRNLVEAGIVSGMLIRNYSDLVAGIGTDAERASFAKSAFAYEKKVAQWRREILVADAEADRRDNRPDATGYQIERLNQRIGSMDRFAQKTATDSALWARTVTPSFVATTGEYYMHYSPIRLYDMHMSFNFDLDARKTNGFLDRAVSYSASGMTAFRKMTPSMMVRLFDIQWEYYRLSNLVVGSPVAPADYGLDTSLSMPFVSPLP